MAAKVVASTKTGQEHLEDKGLSSLIWPSQTPMRNQNFNNCVLSKFVSCADTMDFSGMSLIKLRKEEMESQVSVLLTCRQNIHSYFLMQ